MLDKVCTVVFKGRLKLWVLALSHLYSFSRIMLLKADT